MSKQIKPLDVPFEYQKRPHWCGPTALMLVARFHGVEIAAGIFASHCSTRKTGTDCDLMSNGSRIAGLHAFETFHGTPEQVREFFNAGFPVIIYAYDERWPDKGHGEFDKCHYLIVTAVGEDHWVMHDTDPPEERGGPHQISPLDEVLRVWSSDTEDPEEGGGPRWMLVVAPHKVDKRFEAPFRGKRTRKSKKN